MSDEESFVILGSSPLSSLHFYANSLHDGLEMEENGSVVEDGPQAQSNVDSPASLSQLSTLSEQTKSAEGSLPTTLPSQQTSLATGFLMGEVKPDVLKNSVYSQFPSLCSMQACAEDVVKLQTMMTEYIGLKQTLDKVNHTMQEYYKITQQWRQEAAIREQQYQDQLKQCQMQIEKLTVENQQLKKELETNLEQIRLVEDMHQKEHDDLRQSVSEKSSLINNMRVQIDKLQQHQLHSYDFVPDVVNLTSAEELLNAMRVDVNQLRAKDAQKDEEIAYLKTQIDIYRRDFEMERADRQKNAGEKEQYLVDLRALQRRNQELIESLAEVHNSKKVIHTATGAVQSSLRAEQRPVLDPTGAAARTSDSFMRCPICLKSFSSLSVLQSHVNDCLDKN
ncbi:GH21536 [Drosophila grimshawi]|uniref:GH21536 n=1 Tax=Drosophila grimshawi TaxID=7222 RepID=B4J4D2_DROGR|nr:GH21536 [Drosophila grimshawi]